jgi:hypothetical protein
MHADSYCSTPPDGAQIHSKPEWVRIDEAVRRFGISRSRLYQLISEKRIKSFALRERNQIKGTRLLSYDSLVEFFEREAQAAAEQEAVGNES